MSGRRKIESDALAKATYYQEEIAFLKKQRRTTSTVGRLKVYAKYLRQNLEIANPNAEASEIERIVAEFLA